MKKKIIHFTSQNLDKRNYDRWGIDFFLKNNWKVEYWHVRNVIFPKKKESSETNNSLEYLNLVTHKTFNSFFQLLKAIIKQDNNFIFKDDVGFSFKALLAKRILYFKGGKRIMYSEFQGESWISFFKKKHFSFYLKKGLDPKYFLRGIIFTLRKTEEIFSKLLLNTKPFIHFTCGIKEYTDSIKKYGQGIQCKTHSMNYDIYLDNFKYDIVSEDLKDKIVFIDQDLPLPWDRRLTSNIPMFSSENKYWDSINLFLDFLEKKYNKEAVIARHPRANINKVISQKRILQNQTPQLIQNSFVVICHASLSMELAILWNKPLILITVSALDQSLPVNLALSFYSNALKKKVINVDNFTKNEIENEIKVYNHIYEKFIQNYIKDSSSLNIPLWSIINEELNKRFIIERKK